MKIVALLVAVAYGSVAWHCIAERRYVLVIVFSVAANFLLYAAVGSKLWPQRGEKYR